MRPIKVDRWLATLWPLDCVLCGLPGAADGWCTHCRALLAPSLALCGRCAQPLAAPGDCLGCRERPPPWIAACLPFVYAWPLDRLIAEMKFARRLSVARALGNLLADAAVSAVPGRPRVVPVPLHPRRLAARGFNQAQEIALPVARRLGAALDPRALTRVRDARPQSRLPAAMRRRNLAAALRADPARVRGLDLLLVDDVHTTGSTARAATRALLAAGARSVALAAVAVALSPRAGETYSRA